MNNNTTKLKEYKHLFWVILLITTCMMLCACNKTESDEPQSSIPLDSAEIINHFNTKMSALQESIPDLNMLQADIESQADYNSETAPFVVFFSICDTESRAKVVHGTAQTLNDAWKNASQAARKIIQNKQIDPVWLKVDIVSGCSQSDQELLKKMVEPCYDEMFRMGISFDDEYSISLLEAEINGNKLIDYDNDILDLETINEYLEQYDLELNKIPDHFLLFTCRSWLCDEGCSVYELNDDLSNYGRRKIDQIDKDYCWEIIDSATGYLADMQKEDGSFLYGYYPTYDRELKDYNILRHIASIWSLLNYYQQKPSEELKAQIESGIDYALDTSLEYKDDQTAFIIEHKSDEVKLGGNGLAVIILSVYMDVFDTDQYKDICCALGNGILAMMDQNSGEFYHVLNYPDYSDKEAFRTVYYDGEATFALCRLYGMTKDKKWLSAAQSAVDHFIADDYTQYRDHWVAYSLNEITKYVPSEEYFTFALQNVQNNIKQIHDQKTTWHTYMELLMASFELYDRLITSGNDVEYLDQFDAAYFIDTIFYRADYMLNGFGYPEYVMYLKVPKHYKGGFFIRHDGYRIRIDDLEHFLGGYYKFYTNYDKLCYYKDYTAQ